MSFPRCRPFYQVSNKEAEQDDHADHKQTRPQDTCAWSEHPLKDVHLGVDQRASYGLEEPKGNSHPDADPDDFKFAFFDCLPGKLIHHPSSKVSLQPILK
jgi:hypothetical protein